MTVVTEPLPNIGENVDVRRASRNLFGVERREIEAGLRARVEIETAVTSFGRRRAADPETTP